MLINILILLMIGVIVGFVILANGNINDKYYQQQIGGWVFIVSLVALILYIMGLALGYLLYLIIS